MAEGRCPVCKQYQHKNPGSMTPDQISRHRIREKRDCVEYEECLTVQLWRMPSWSLASGARSSKGGLDG